MHLLFNYFIRFILIIIISLFYLKYRNNQCIKNQNCKPYFISNLLSFKKEFEYRIPIAYKLEDSLANIDLSIESTLKIEDLAKDKDIKEEYLGSYIAILEYFKKTGYDDADLIKNNDIIIKKFSLTNTSTTAISVFPKMTFDEKFFKIFNCFCDSKVIVEPMSTKNIYIYFKVKNFFENAEDNDKNNNSKSEFSAPSIKVSI